MNDYNKFMIEQSEKERLNRIELFKDIFCDILKDLRQEKKLSQKQIAFKLGVAVSTYANWEQGRREPSIYDIYNLMWCYEIDANELFPLDLTKYIKKS